ncbi:MULTISPECIES: mechanosensitive ion channel family protein [Psychrobacter]|uniref:MscS family membrane protein n=2 Tax=Psychrobacter pacificensis TaxID=112002 RepID=A0A1G6Z4C5_9GAMM|nr:MULTISPECIES: mechanosensitive ion channel family protein [Psychrobacter]MDE0842843.1 mechanosensitive ion channel [Psychrobacter pacificensis]SDD97381.1 MscS family membrane protein [Psychrobacter pacificensis]HBL96488.1 mechanosensitive ion channel family protein [Psychrobacter sp.]
MSTQHNLTPSTASSLLNSIIKISSIVIALVLAAVLSMVVPHTAFAVDAGALGVNGDSSEETVATPLPDSFGRDTPRHTVQGFISALSENDYLLASNYLNLSKSDNPTTVVRQFKQALDAGGRFQPDLQISNTPEGNLTDQLPPSQENVGVINIGEKSVSLLLERVVSKENEQYWQFSSETLSSIPEVIENSEPTLVSRYTVDSLDGKKLFGYQLADLVAALSMIVSSFVLTYIAVWLLYHLLRIVYPRVRGVPLPLPDKVILPLSVVIMALILSEVMVYAGVSVTLREPVNRFTDIASWLALTWLLLRVIDAIFTRAVNLSYKKNYTERVSILGLLRKVVKALLLIFAVIVIFGNLGFDLTTGIAALGVGGLALALGAQKTIENLVGSVVVVADSPVRIGDYCKFGTYEGTVIDIGIRSSRVRTLTRTVVTVPNGDFSSMQIENFTSRDMFRFFHQLYLKRTADIDVVFKMVKDLDEFLKEHEMTNQEWNQVNILELRQDCYVIQLQAYINANDVMEFYDKQNVVFVDVLNQVAKYDVEHALPTQQLIVNQAELEHHMENNIVKTEDDASEDHSDTNSNETNVSLEDNDDNNSDDVTINKDTDNANDDMANNQKSSMATVSRKGALKALKHKSRMLRKSKFKHTKNKFSLSIWNQP